MTPDQRRILRDLSNTMRSRVTKNLEDFASCCEAVDIEADSVVDEMIATFLAAAISAAIERNTSLDDFIRLAINHFAAVQANPTRKMGRLTQS